MGYRRAGLADWLTRTVGRTVDLWITISRAQQELLQSYFGIRRPVQLVPNVAIVETGTAAVAHRLADGCLPVVFLGRYDAFQKGLDWLCRALRERHEKWTGRMRFQFFGDGEFRPDLEELATTCSPGEITVGGWTETSKALAGAGLLLLPSRFEGFPLVFIEAAKAGVPILSTTFAGARALLGEGAWVDFGDTDGLIAALLRMTEEKRRDEVARIQKASLESQSSPRMFDLAVSELARCL
jgi:glycosyltransferase involved in cell wall biosynthesis